MQVPAEVAFRNVEPTDELKARIQEGIRALEEVYEGIISCRVMVEDTTPARKAGKLHHVRLDITVPRNELVVNRNPPAHPSSHDLPQALNEAFDKARRQLVELKRIQKGSVKTSGLPPHGRVVRLLTDGDGSRFGFIMTGEGRELYFHENSVVGMAFDDLDVGSEVRFAEEGGKEGPQASTVAPLEWHAVGPRQEEEIPLGTTSGGRGTET